MAFKIFGPSQSLAVTSTGQSVDLPLHAESSRVFNAGPNSVRIVYGRGAQTVDDTGMLMPSGLVETHVKVGYDTLSAKCAPGETATLQITCGSGD